MEFLRRLTVMQAAVLSAIILLILIVAVLTFDNGDDEPVDYSLTTPTLALDYSNAIQGTPGQFVPVNTFDPLGGN